MIKQNELRSGNLLQDNAGRILIVDEILEHYARLRAVNLIVSIGYERLQPIPLSEEWLLRFGFSQINIGGWKYKNLEIDHITTEDHYETELKLTLGDWILKPLKYVHELQNYFFVIYSEELTVKQE